MLNLSVSHKEMSIIIQMVGEYRNDLIDRIEAVKAIKQDDLKERLSKDVDEATDLLNKLTATFIVKEKK